MQNKEFFTECKIDICEFKNFIDLLDDIVLLQNSSGEYIYLNNKGKTFVKKYLKNKTVLGKKPDQIFSKEDADKIKIQLKQVIDKKEPLTVENWFSFKNKKFCFHETIIPLPNKDDDPVVIAKIGKDITKQKMMGQSLKESEIKFLKLIENIPCGLLIIQDEKIKIINSGFSKITGHPQNQFKTFNDVIDIICPHYKQLVYQNYKKIISDKKVPSVYNIEITTKSEEKRMLRIFSTKIKFSNKPAIMAAFFDITNMKIMEKELTKQKKKLVKEVEEKTESLKKSKDKYKKTNRYLIDLINSSNDIIIAFNELNNLIIWNKTIEKITDWTEPL